MASQTRSALVDWLKAIGIFLVVLGHVTDGWAIPIIYAFHMPLFFTLSGYVLKEERVRAPFARFYKTSLAPLVRAYLAYALFHFAIWFLVLSALGHDTTWRSGSPDSRLLGIIFASSEGDLWPDVLWFFPCLVSSLCLYWLTFRLPPPSRYAALAALALIGFLLGSTAWLPWELDTASVAVAFIALGYELSHRPALMRRLSPPHPLIPVASFALLALLSLQVPTVDMRTGHFSYPPLFILNAVGMVLSLMVYFRGHPRAPLVERVARETLVIFPLHPLAIIFVQGCWKQLLHRDVRELSQPLPSLALALGLVAFLTWTAPVVRRALL